MTKRSKISRKRSVVETCWCHQWKERPQFTKSWNSYKKSQFWDRPFCHVTAAPSPFFHFSGYGGRFCGSWLATRLWVSLDVRPYLLLFGDSLIRPLFFFWWFILICSGPQAENSTVKVKKVGYYPTIDYKIYNHLQAMAAILDAILKIIAFTMWDFEGLLVCYLWYQILPTSVEKPFV